MSPQMVHSAPDFTGTFTDGRLLDSRDFLRAPGSGGTLTAGMVPNESAESAESWRAYEA